MLAYGISVDACDEYCNLSKSTAEVYMTQVCLCYLDCFESTYNLRQPTREGMVQQIAINDKDKDKS